ncbi:MAG: YidC/Oxa1 family membrane protein insertase [Patescibacteria group bacterium]
MFEVLGQFWYTFLLQPLFNVLIWLYSHVADGNLGWAVIWMTVFLRILLLPLTIISERNAVRQQEVEEEAYKTAKVFKGDQVKQNEEIRRIMKKKRISPWAKVLTLLIQLLVLVLLYQVFVKGITGDKVIKLLYSGIDFPGKIDVLFYGYDIGRVHDSLWAAVAAVYLFLSILWERAGDKHWQTSEITFLFIFPLFTFFALWWLPMVKSLFILTTMMFSDIISLIRRIIWPVKKT